MTNASVVKISKVTICLFPLPIFRVLEILQGRKNCILLLGTSLMLSLIPFPIVALLVIFPGSGSLWSTTY